MSILSFDEYRYVWDVVSKKPFLTGFPLHLDVELTSRCNLRCKICFQQHMTGKRVDMSEKMFKNIVDEGAEEGLSAMKLQSRGESLLHPNIIDFLAYAKEKNISDVHITTNGLLMNDNIIGGLVESGLDLLILSYDLTHAEASHMKESEYTAFMQDIVDKVCSKRNKTKKSRMKIRIQTSIQDYTTENIQRSELQNRSLFPAADFILTNPIYTSFEDDPHLINLDAYDFYPCSYLWQRLTIYSDGSVTTCSRDYNCKYNRVGSVSESSIHDLWHSTLMRNMRRDHLADKRKNYHICALCENYLLNRKTGLPGAGCTGTVYPLNSRSANS